ncbi:type VI secretion system-associated protein TagF [Agaribacterium sp. ZY112]|uniref:type VI secretion system-associated protein TagF n=1 Tax=Agaribacterium sp. ZY112 TaxID=3233574 RepID=UPI003526A2C6
MTLGIFGKIPAHGDFIDRQCPRSFLDVWDEWLQRAVSSSQEILADSWLDIYLTSPIWRFASSPGVIDQSAWAGILVPSVDSVGRYFPLTIASTLESNSNLFEFMANNDDWFTSLEESALGALQSQFQADQLMESLKASTQVQRQISQTPATPPLINQARVAFGNGDIANSYPQLLHSCFASLSSYSLWACKGSANMPAATLASPSLPEPTQYAAMLEGNWQRP